MKTALAMLGAMLITAAAPPTVPLQPSGKWTVEYGESMCLVSRQFGTGDAAVVFALRPLPLGERDELVLMTRDAAGRKYRSDKGSVMLQPSGKTIEGEYQTYRLLKTTTRVTTMWFNHEDLASLVDSSGVSVHAGQDARVSVATGDMKRAFAALATCQDDLLKAWGIDPAIAKAITTRPKGNPGRFFGPDAYPPKAIRAGEIGAVIVVYMVGLDGRARDCRVVASSRSEALDEATCGIVEKRIRYSPALDKDGKPTAAPTTLRVNWVIP